MRLGAHQQDNEMRLAEACVAAMAIRLGHVPAGSDAVRRRQDFRWRPEEIIRNGACGTFPRAWPAAFAKQTMCEDCGMLFLDMRFDDEEMAALYADYRGEATLASVIALSRAMPRASDHARGSAYIGPNRGDSGALSRREAARARLGATRASNTPFRSRAMQHDCLRHFQSPDGRRRALRRSGYREASVYDLIVSVTCWSMFPFRESLFARCERDAPGAILTSRFA